ncbi:Uncharacterized protein APZ42_025778 [Daphnia magna]|uniref:Uncharacterized protein n=1 Tax=Daphnia magna TaxID=35525 RepID=A0A164SUJ2_9CRUS|nr:Uncharacterized protein APZ42_025778 [Daphnia magna]
MKQSTLDLTVISNLLVPRSSIYLGPHLDSDHTPICIKIQLKVKIEKPKTQPKWKFALGKWANWNSTIVEELKKCKFNEIEDPKDAFQTFYEIVLEG